MVCCLDCVNNFLKYLSIKKKTIFVVFFLVYSVMLIGINKFLLIKKTIFKFLFNLKCVAVRTFLGRILQFLTANHHTVARNPQLVEAAVDLQANKLVPKFQPGILRLGRSLISSTF